MKVTITPDMAKKLMLLNTKNRSLSAKTVSSYARDMADGRWPYNGDPIRVSETKVLLDGQHRLQAIIDSGVSIDCELIEGLPDEVGLTIDGGRKRRAADILNIRDGGSMSASSVVAVAKQSLNYLFGFHCGMMQSTPAIISFLDAHPDIEEMAQLARHVDKVAVPSVLGAVLFLGTRAPGFDKRARAFVEPLKHGEGLAAGDARLALRNAFINQRARSRGAGMINQAWALNITIFGWNAFATGRELQFMKAGSLTFKPGEYRMPNIIGGPTFGSGLSGLKDVRVHGKRKLAELEETVAQPSDKGGASALAAIKSVKIVAKQK